MSEKALCFAYRSNMLSRQLFERAPSAKIVGRAVLSGYRFLFNKLSKDGTAKGNIQKDEHGSVHGMVFEMSEEDVTWLPVSETKGSLVNFVSKCAPSRTLMKLLSVVSNVLLMADKKDPCRVRV